MAVAHTQPQVRVGGWAAPGVLAFPGGPAGVHLAS